MISNAVTTRAAIPRIVWTLGFVSLFMDMSSELVHSLLPMFLVTTMGLSVTAVGLIEGTAEATALIVKIFSGAISDYLGRRKGLILFGYGFAALTKPLFPLANSAFVVVVARLLDRICKGIRGAPRDALLADVSPVEIRGACFGLRQSMDTVGAFLGPMAAIALMFVYANNIRAVLWFAVLPAAICVAFVIFGVDEPDAAIVHRRFRSPLKWQALRQFSLSYWLIVGLGTAFALARFSEAFLVLRAREVGIPLEWVPGVMVIMSATYSLSAYPAGILSDRINRRWVLAFGLALLIAADLLLGLGHSVAAVLLGVAVWGLHMGFTQGILSAMIAEASPAALRGTAFGVFNLACGLCMIVASGVAGWLWDHFGSATTFIAGATLAVVPLVLNQCMPRQRNAVVS
ncbi:MAG TPA: MFS transporter [Rhodocyclaceae bacterium]|nr:MFS transporter [Rhodocyclaceae bacterium]